MLDILDREVSLEFTGLGLTQIQAESLLVISRCGVVTASQIMEITGRSRQNTYDALNFLVSKLWIVREGKKPNTKFSLRTSIFNIINEISDDEIKHHLEVMQRISNVVSIFSKDLETASNDPRHE